jgi:hypothetical protein
MQIPQGYCEKYTIIENVIRKDPLPPLELNTVPFGEPEVQQDLFVHLNQSGLKHQRHPPPEISNLNLIRVALNTSAIPRLK